MRLLLVTIVAGLLAGCLSSVREREVHCLGTLMQDVWESKERAESLEADWRARRQERFDAATRARLMSNEFAPEPTAVSAPVPLSRTEALNEEALYERLTLARQAHRDTRAWYERVAKRVQTRFEEDEMLYPVLGTFVTAAPASLLFYPVIRWNVRSVLWEEGDPDAEDDPVGRYCLARLNGTH